MNRSKGFLLLEVMVSVAIIAGGLIFVTRVYSTAKYALQRSSVLFKSSLLLESQIFEYEEKGGIRENLSDGRVFTDDRDYSWAVTSAPLPADPVFNQILPVSLTRLDVSRRRDGDQRRGNITVYSLWTYLNTIR